MEIRSKDNRMKKKLVMDLITKDKKENAETQIAHP